jgi:hypothetical protein
MKNIRAIKLKLQKFRDLVPYKDVKFPYMLDVVHTGDVFLWDNPYNIHHCMNQFEARITEVHRAFTVIKEIGTGDNEGCITYYMNLYNTQNHTLLDKLNKLTCTEISTDDDETIIFRLTGHRLTMSKRRS